MANEETDLTSEFLPLYLSDRPRPHVSRDLLITDAAKAQIIQPTIRRRLAARGDTVV